MRCVEEIYSLVVNSTARGKDSGMKLGCSGTGPVVQRLGELFDARCARAKQLFIDFVAELCG